MPTRTEILAGLTAIATRAGWLAVAWHVVIAFAVVAVVAGWRPSQRLARGLLALPLISVAALAFASGNPFNGIVCGAAAIALIALARTGSRAPVAIGPAWASIVGVALLAYAWSYPHFLAGAWTSYLYRAPVGLVPCPTLALATGGALLAGGLGARAWSLTLAACALFYGVFGVVRLGVTLDLGLVAGALALGVVAYFSASVAFSTSTSYL